MIVKCPTCNENVEWNAKAEHRPFCSKRCQLIDLGDWADENHAIVANEHKQDMLPDNINAEDIDIEDIEEMLAKENGNDSFFN